jgi:hypothetical protein
MNTNAIHNLLNLLIAITSGLTAFLLATGCIASPTGALVCTGSWLSPELTTMAVAGLSVAKIVINIARDGLTGLMRPQPPVAR